MKTNLELRAALTSILTRLDKDKHSSDEWETIRKHLARAELYAAKCRDMRKLLETKHSMTDSDAKE